MPITLHNLSHTTPVHVLRTMTPEALEYQQSLEVENIWPEKLMYAIMLPHKAWAAGDTLVAVLKLSPLAKGGSITSVVTTLWETTELHYASHRQHEGKSGIHQESRIVRRVKHDIVNGRAVSVDFVDSAMSGGKSSCGSNTPAGPCRLDSRPGSSRGLYTSMTSSENPSVPVELFENHDVSTYITLPIPLTFNASIVPGTPTNTGFGSLPLPSPSASTTPLTSRPPSPTLPSFPTTTITPSHAVEPILVAHRVRWSIYIRNRDGHTSELGCSLPIHILDGRVLDEARTASLRSRRMMLQGLWNAAEEDTIGMGSGGMESLDETANELPSYMAHLRDRVANMYYPETATMRVPWAGIVANGEAEGGCNDLNTVGVDVVDPHESEGVPPSDSTGLRSECINSGHHSGSDETHHYPFSHRSSAGSTSTPLDWVNAKLLSSASSRLRQHRYRTTITGLDSPQQVQSRPHSRATSPERERGPSGVSEAHGGGDAHVHGHGHGNYVRNLSSLFKATMKPFTSLTHHGQAREHHGERHGFFGHSASFFGHGEHHRHHSSHPPSSSSSRHPSPTRMSSAPLRLPSQFVQHLPHHASSPPSESSPLYTPSLSTLNSASALHRSLSEVPDYSFASRGFMGGVPPLSSSKGLPSYEEAAMEGTDGPGTSSRRLQVTFVGENENEGTINNTNTVNPSRRETVSDTDLLENFKREMGILQRIESRESVQSISEDEEEEDDDERIEVRVKSHGA